MAAAFTYYEQLRSKLASSSYHGHLGGMHTLWVLSNADVHGKDETTRVTAPEKHKVARKLALIYDQ